MDGDLRLTDITKRYPGVTALDKVSVSFRQGEVHAIVGENGAGKSTLIKTIAGAISPDSGTIQIGDKVFESLTPAQSKDCGVAVVYQELVQFEAMSVAENIFMGMKLSGKNVYDKGLVRRRAKEILDSFGVDINPDAIIRELSIASRQIVEIAKAVVQNAKIIIMDEPTASITVEEQRKLFYNIKSLQSQGVTIIYISHRLEELFEICNRVTVFRDGKYITTKNIEDTDKQDLIQLMVGRELSETYPKGACPQEEVVLSVENLSGNGVQNISFQLHRGEILGFAGLVGAGRTELMHLIYGAAKREGGTVTLNGKPINPKIPADAMAAGIGLIPEDRKGQGCFLDKRIDWNISISNMKAISKGLVVDSSKERKRAQEYKELLNIKTPDLRHLTLSLSGGNQQKVVIAKALAAHSDILIFDEPTRGIDVGARYEIYTTMIELARQGKSILMVSSDMEELLGMSQRIAVLHDGQLAGILNRDECSQDKILALASGM